MYCYNNPAQQTTSKLSGIQQSAFIQLMSQQISWIVLLISAGLVQRVLESAGYQLI